VDLGTAGEAVAPDFVIDKPEILQVPTDATDWQDVDRTITANAQRL
jgi:hypothetical protein